MKLAILLIVLGAILVADGMVRIFIGITSETWVLVIASLITGIGLGSYLLLRGLRRLRRVRQSP